MVLQQDVDLWDAHHARRKEYERIKRVPSRKPLNEMMISTVGTIHTSSWESFYAREAFLAEAECELQILVRDISLRQDWICPEASVSSSKGLESLLTAQRIFHFVTSTIDKSSSHKANCSRKTWTMLSIQYYLTSLDSHSQRFEERALHWPLANPDRSQLS